MSGYLPFVGRLFAGQSCGEFLSEILPTGAVQNLAVLKAGGKLWQNEAVANLAAVAGLLCVAFAPLLFFVRLLPATLTSKVVVVTCKAVRPRSTVSIRTAVVTVMPQERPRPSATRNAGKLCLQGSYLFFRFGGWFSSTVVKTQSNFNEAHYPFLRKAVRRICSRGARTTHRVASRPSADRLEGAWRLRAALILSRTREGFHAPTR